MVAVRSIVLTPGIKLCIFRRMRTTIEIDDSKVKMAQALYANLNKTELVDLALTELIRLEKNRQLARLRGKFPGLREVPRRRF